MRDRPRDYFRDPRYEMIGFVPENAKKILDVGCGEGFFGYQLKREINVKIWGKLTELQRNLLKRSFIK